MENDVVIFLGPLECLRRARSNFLNQFAWPSLFGDLLNPLTPLGIWLLGERVSEWESLHLSVVDFILSNRYK